MIGRLKAEKSTSLLQLVEEKALSKEEMEKERRKQLKNLIPYLPKDCISNILVRLPLESLQRLRFVCKSWYRIVNSPTFIDAHLRSSDTVLIFSTPVRRDIYFPNSTKSSSSGKQNTLAVESKLFQSQCPFGFQQSPVDPISSFHIKFVEIKDGKGEIKEYNLTCLGKIRATCNGLILLDNEMKKGGLIVMNPVTRELTALPLGTLFPSHDESYGFVFCSRTSEYKVVHLFRDEMLFVGCEILNLPTRSWRMVNGPSFGLFTWFGYGPVFAEEALHWVPHVDYNDYIISMSMDDEKFLKIPLPKTCRWHDRIFEMVGLLGLVIHEEVNKIDVWILRSLCGEGWKKKYSIRVGCEIHVIPLYLARSSGEIIFTDDNGFLYAYDPCLQVTRNLHVKKGCFAVDGCFLPHINSLVSWQVQAKGEHLSD